ncbi:MAG: hypothetical protein PHD76_11305 [Methylacidiphilales bacterium]|nr:hypothetical protein [Candidatus Methylacidiphilales bacterium]
MDESPQAVKMSSAKTPVPRLTQPTFFGFGIKICWNMVCRSENQAHAPGKPWPHGPARLPLEFIHREKKFESYSRKNVTNDFYALLDFTVSVAYPTYS